MEMLTWSFPAVKGDAAILAMHWGTTTIPVQVLAQPTEPVAVAAEERAVFVGAYDMEILPLPGWETTGQFVVSEQDGKLIGRLPFPIHPGDEMDFDLVPAGLNRFSPGLYRDGVLFNIEMGVTFEFEVPGDYASTVVMRGIEGTAFGSGKRAEKAASR